MIACILFTAACVNAHPPIQQEHRNVSNFSGIKAGGAFIITVVHGKENSVKIEAETQMLSRIKTEVKDGMLNIYTDGKTETDSPMKIYVTMNEFRKADVSGATRLMSDEEFVSENVTLNASGAGSIDMKLKATEVNVTAAGAGKIEVKGFAGKLIASLTGASSLSAYELQTDFASVKTKDASNAKITARETLNAQANGASYINYKGDPTKESINTSGASFIEKEGV